MNKVPPHIVIIIVWGVLIGFLTFDFFKKASVNFVQFNYNWNASQILETMGQVTIDSISHDYISIYKNFQLPEKYNNNNTFLLKNTQQSYFRASEIITDSTKIVFSGIKWINQIPNKKAKEAELQIVTLPLLQPKGKSTVTIGDSQIIWREAQEFRKNLVRKKKLFYLGSETDAYGYPYEGGIFDTSSEILKKAENAPPAEFYILFFGAQDKKVAKELTDANVCAVLKTLQNKNNVESVFAITLPPSTNEIYNAYNTAFNIQLKLCAKQFQKVTIIDFNSFLSDKKNYLTEDEIHLNTTGYLYLNKLLTQQIN